MATIILFKRPVRGLLPNINRMPKIYDYDDEHYETLKERQQWADRCDTGKDFTIIPVQSTTVVQTEDGGLHTHGTVVEHSFREYTDKSNRIPVMVTDCIITRKT